MECVEFRVKNGVLEYRSLIINEENSYDGSENCVATLSVDYRKQYTEWKPVPVVG